MDDPVMILADRLNSVEEARRLVKRGFLSCREVARLAHRAPGTVREWIKERYGLTNGRLLVSVEDAIELIKGMKR